MFRNFVLGLVTLGVAASAPAFAAEPIGSAFAISGSVTGEVRSAPPRLLAAGSDVFFNEHIHARTQSNGQFRFVDGSRFVVGAGSDVVLDEFVYRRGAANATIRVTKGAMRFIGAGTRPGRDKVSIRTPVAVVGIRGTVVDVTHTPGRTAFLLLHGSAQVCARGGGCRLVTEPCTGVVVQRGVSGIRRPSAAELAADFPLLAAQNGLWNGFRAATTCGVSPTITPPMHAGGEPGAVGEGGGEAEDSDYGGGGPGNL